MGNNLDELLQDSICWNYTGNPEIPFVAKLAGHHELLIRLNDFPAGPLYTVIVDGTEIGDLDEWPSKWQRPNISKLREAHQEELNEDGGNHPKNEDPSLLAVLGAAGEFASRFVSWLSRGAYRP